MSIKPNVIIQGIVTQGHQVASGSSPSSPFPEGTIKLQNPCFVQAGIDLSDCYLGTLNISISSYQFQISKAEHTLRDVRWIDSHPPETYSFVSCHLNCKSVSHSSWPYYPHPETKVMHYQPLSLMGILSQEIHGSIYGDRISLAFSSDSVQFTQSSLA